MDLIEWAETYIWPTERDSFLAWCELKGHSEIASQPDGWRLFVDYSHEPVAPRVPPPPRVKGRMFVPPREPVGPCSICGRPVARAGNDICMGCTFPKERAKRRRQRCPDCYPELRSISGRP